MSAIFSNNLLILILFVLAALIGIGLIIFGLFRFRKSPNVINQRMQAFVANREKSTPFTEKVYRATPREVKGSFYDRTVTPFFQRIINFFGKYTPANSIAKSDHDLRIAGNPLGMHAREFYGVRVAILFIGIVLAFLFYSRYGFSNTGLLIALIIIIISLYIPRLWLNSRVRGRKEDMGYNLPDVLDMLSVCASAGMSFDQGLKKICEYWPTPLIQEFKQVLQEMDMGIPRSEALRNLKNRMNVNELSSFIAVIIQSENTGMSYADTLQNQAKQMRIFRQYRAKEKANALPAKMIIPVVIFIFPALIAVILGPIVPQMLNFFK